jgi:hypothetical protein
MLRRYSSYLTQNGVFIVRMAGRANYEGIITDIESNFAVVEKHRPEHSIDPVLVFR